LLVEATNEFKLLLQEVDDREQGDPNNVNEVPVVRHNDGAGCFEVTKLLSQHRATNDQQECNQTTSDVNAVEAGRNVEGRSVGVRVECHALANEDSVFVGLDRNEDRSKEEGQNEPFNHSPFLEVENPTGTARLEFFGTEHA